MKKTYIVEGFGFEKIINSQESIEQLTKKYRELFGPDISVTRYLKQPSDYGVYESLKRAIVKIFY